MKFRRTYILPIGGTRLERPGTLASTATPSAMTALPRPLRDFASLTFKLSALCLLVELFCGLILHWPFPYNWPIPAIYPFSDFYTFKPQFAYFHSAAYFSFHGPFALYPAPLLVAYRFFYYFPYSTATFLTTLTAFFLLGAVLLWRALTVQGVSALQTSAFVGTIALLSYPFWFEFQRANMEFVVCLFVTSGIWAFLKGRGYSAAVCFGIAGAMKIFPLVFLGLFLSRRQYRQLLVTLATLVTTTVVTLWLLCPDISLSWHEIQREMNLSRSTYMLRYSEVGFDHSLFAVSKAALILGKFFTHATHPPGPELLSRLLSIYLPLAAVTGTGLYFWKIQRLPVINQVICLTVAAVLLPPLSYDYTLIHLYAPWAALVLFAVERQDTFTPGLAAALSCFAILFAPVSEVIIHRHSSGGQVKAFALVALMIVALRYRFPSSFDRTETTAAA